MSRSTKSGLKYIFGWGARDATGGAVSWSTVRGAPVAALERAASCGEPVSSGVSRQSSHISGVSLHSLIQPHERLDFGDYT